MSDWRVKGVLDRFGGIEWIVFHASKGLAQPTAVVGDYELTQIKDQIREQRADLDKLRGLKKRSGKPPSTHAADRGSDHP